jgi:glycosyltransferase involved in cell wall biosynthesis
MSSKRVPLVSVLIPLYNHERYIEQCLDSIRDEGWANIELIIHDDRSPDNSWQIAQHWLVKNPEAFSSVVIEQAKNNRGVVGALNRLLDLATGDYLVCPLASDDALLPGGIAARVKALESRPDWLAVFADAVTMDDDSNDLCSSYLFEKFHSNKQRLLSDTQRRMEMIVRWSVPGPVIMYRKHAFDPERGVGRYNPTLCIEDRDMYLRLLAKQQLGFIENKVARYRLHANNTMSSPKIRIQSMLDRATPLLTIASNENLTRTERFVALHTGNALLAHAKRRSSKSPIKRLGYSLERAMHTVLARSAANLYFAKGAQRSG